MASEKTPMILDLPESLLLLAADDESGKVDSKWGALAPGLGGAVLMELLLQDRLEMAHGNVIVVNSTSTGDAILDRALRRIADSRPGDAKHWVNTLSHDGIREETLNRLIDKGVLRKVEQRFLWIFPDDRYPAENESPERDVREHIRSAVLEGTTPTPRTGALIGIIEACDLTGVVFSKDERKQYKDRIDGIAGAEIVGEAVSKAVQDIQAATMAAVTAATVATTVATS